MPDETPPPKPAAPPLGLYCPDCRGVRLMVVCTKKPCPGLRLRYRVCSACELVIRTKEVVIGTNRKRKHPRDAA